jgi:hypothetical protein
VGARAGVRGMTPMTTVVVGADTYIALERSVVRTDLPHWTLHGVPVHLVNGNVLPNKEVETRWSVRAIPKKYLNNKDRIAVTSLGLVLVEP